MGGATETSPRTKNPAPATEKIRPVAGLAGGAPTASPATSATALAAAIRAALCRSLPMLSEPYPARRRRWETAAVATWALDLDGVLWRGEMPIPGAAEAVARLRTRVERVVFLTNNAGPTIAEHLAKLERMGVVTDPEDLLTSAQAAATMLPPGSTALACAGPGVREALAARGVRIVEAGPADAVVVGWHREFDFPRLASAADAVRAGARLVGTNEDPTFPTPDGLLPGAGALLAAVASASGATPDVAGKPHAPMQRLVEERVGPVATVVGDRPSTDGVFARALGARFALVLSGVTGERELDGLRPAPDDVARDLAALVVEHAGPIGRPVGAFQIGPRPGDGPDSANLPAHARPGTDVEGGMRLSLASPLLGPGTFLDERQRGILEGAIVAEHAGILALPTDEPARRASAAAASRRRTAR